MAGMHRSQEPKQTFSTAMFISNITMAQSHLSTTFRRILLRKAFKQEPAVLSRGTYLLMTVMDLIWAKTLERNRYNRLSPWVWLAGMLYFNQPTFNLLQGRSPVAKASISLPAAARVSRSPTISSLT